MTDSELISAKTLKIVIAFSKKVVYNNTVVAKSAKKW